MRRLASVVVVVVVGGAVGTSGCFYPGGRSRSSHQAAYLADAALVVVGAVLVMSTSGCLSFQACGGDGDVPNVTMLAAVPLLGLGAVGGVVNAFMPAPDDAPVALVALVTP